MGLNVSEWTDFRDMCDVYDLYQLVCAYDDYVRYGFEEGKVAEGWEPVSILEFANSEEFENMRENYM